MEVIKEDKRDFRVFMFIRLWIYKELLYWSFIESLKLNGFTVFAWGSHVFI